MRMLTFARRCGKEILRDPLNLAFGLGFPLVLIGLLSAIQASIPVSLFEIGHLTPGITVFGLSFMTLFSAVKIYFIFRFVVVEIHGHTVGISVITKHR